MAEPLRWRQINQYAAASDRGGYRVSKANIRARVIYTAWVEGMNGKYKQFASIRYCESKEEAIQACNAHYGATGAATDARNAEASA